jgi:GntR family transcriptional repressor for pyruvate dehydrogenase complex
MFRTVQKQEKVSNEIIDQVRETILSGKLKPGDKLASETELTKRFGVSKATMREAQRVLEAMGLIEIRKGIAGGSFVAEVDMRTTTHSIINFLHFQKVSIKEITMLRYFIEPPVAQIAALRNTDKDIEKLGSIIAESRVSGDGGRPKGIGFHHYLVRIVGNPILILMIDFVDNLIQSIKEKHKQYLGPEFYQSMRKDHELVLECLIQKDPFAAAVAMSQDILTVDRYLCEVAQCEPFRPMEFFAGFEYQYLWHNKISRARIVSQGDELLDKPSIFAQRIGTSNLFVAMSSD